jgi:hypothetical protein
LPRERAQFYGKARAHRAGRGARRSGLLASFIPVVWYVAHHLEPLFERAWGHACSLRPSDGHRRLLLARRIADVQA